jgi:hypothetical protein
MTTQTLDDGPWYRQRWPWILMAGPATVLVAGVITTWIAFETSDGLVAQDYYKQGLAVNKVLAREGRAASLGIEARVELPGDRHRIVVTLAPGRLATQPQALRINFAHATRAGHDQALALVRVADGRYEAAVPQALPPGRWNVRIEALNGDWRLAGEWSGREPAFSLGGKTS